MFDELVFNRISMQLKELNNNIKSLQKTIERNNAGTTITTKNPYGPINISDYDIGLPVITATATEEDDVPLFVVPMMEPTKPVDKQGGLQEPWPFPTTSVRWF